MALSDNTFYFRRAQVLTGRCNCEGCSFLPQDVVVSEGPLLHLTPTFTKWYKTKQKLLKETWLFHSGLFETILDEREELIHRQKGTKSDRFHP